MAVPGVGHAVNHHPGALFVSANEQRVLDHAKTHPEGVLPSPSCEIEQFAQTITVRDDVDIVQLNVWAHQSNGLKCGLERVFGNSKRILIDVLAAGIRREGHWQ